MPHDFGSELTQQNLNAALVYWQRRLRLTQWNLVAEIVRGRDLENCLAQIAYVPMHREGVIKVMDACDHDDYEFKKQFPVDWEQSVVHELLELHFGPFKERDGNKWEAQETAINMIADAMVSLTRPDPANAQSLEGAEAVAERIMETQSAIVSRGKGLASAEGYGDLDPI